MSVESEDDVDGLKRAWRVVAVAIAALRRSVRTGVPAQELDDDEARSLQGPSVPELPVGTIIAGFSHCTCNACGEGCDSDEKRHTSRLPGYIGERRSGCGILFTHVTTRTKHSSGKSAARRMRPDLIFIEFPD